MAFSISSYSLKYYKEFTNLRKDRVRLEIYEKGASLSSDYPMEIGELNGLALEVEGRSESVDVPIVKSTLTFFPIMSFICSTPCGQARTLLSMKTISLLSGLLISCHVRYGLIFPSFFGTTHHGHLRIHPLVRKPMA